MPDDYMFRVAVEITPLWKRPPASLSESMARAAAEARFAAFAHEVEQFIRAGLDQIQREQGDDVERWSIPMRLTDGWFQP